MPASYMWTKTNRSLPDAVTIVVARSGSDVVADVVWPPNVQTAGGDYLYATNVPLALTRAADVLDHYGFDRIVICLDDLLLWNADWGDLVAAD